MKIGVRLPGAGPQASRETLERIARWADALGFHSVWVSDHVVMPDRVDSPYPYAADHRWPYAADHPWLDPLLVLAVVGAAAPHLGLGTSVVVLPLRHPILFAKQVATLDYLTGGRVLLGIGAGWMEEEFSVLGVPFGDRGRRAVEMVRLMRALWEGEHVEFRGRLWEVSGAQMAPPAIQRPVPILWGGHSEHALRRVVQVGDGWHPTRLAPAEVRAGLARLRELSEQHGRDPGSLQVVVRPGDALEDDTIGTYDAMGVHHLVMDPPLDGPDFKGCLRAMERVAAASRLQRRT